MVLGLSNNMKQKFSIQTILPGWGVSEYFYKKGQFLSSLGIDPEMPKTDSDTKPSGLLRPTTMTKISGTEVDSAPVWMETTDKDTNTYVYTKGGKVHVVASNMTMGTALNSGNALTTATGNGLAYYNNYLYGASNTDIWRYGPLNGSPTLAQTFWTGLSLTALANTTYPSIKGITIPNHPMFVHPANSRLYFGDVDSSNVGILSMIKTKKVTAEGDTNDTVVPSSYKVLDMYYGWWPTCICNFGTELAIGLIDGTSTTIKQRNAQVAFWSTVASDTSYNRIADIPDPLITAMKYINGQLYVFSGSAAGGMRISRYLGGNSFEEVFYADDQVPPLQGAVDYTINRIVFGASTSSPAVSASVMALGSKSRALQMGLHNILKTTSAGTTPWVTAVKYVEQGAAKQPLVGWMDGSGYGLDKLGTTYGTSTWRSQVFSLGRNGTVTDVRIPLAQALASNQTITVKIYSDDASTSTQIGVINNTNYTGRDVVLYVPAHFKNNFFIELTWSGTALAVVGMPINLTVEYLNE
jgi:hypothetical protein